MKALIIGGGNAAKVNCMALRSLGVEIAGICDLNIDVAAKMTKEYGGVPYSDMDKALSQDIDFAVICTPSGTHAKLAIKVMEMGKNVVVEKPLALTVKDAQDVLAVQERTGRICAPVSQLRFSDSYIKIKKAIDNGELGTIVMSSLSMKYFREKDYYAGTWRGTKAMDGGELMNQGLHGVDVMCGLLGAPVSVAGKVATRYHDIEAEDTAVAHLLFADGNIGTLDSSTAISFSKARRLEICGTKGLIVLEEDKITLAEGVDLEHDAANEYNGSSDPMNIGILLHARLYQNILAAFEGQEKLLYTAKDAADTVKVICGIYESSETGKAVEIR
ncbi:MAG: Gfo/Idh/MocA family oxidoreductase [Clostridia bacterium]|nr:Gfo/Idh/MocA family oxidoreductase [Clostridia bacterium]